jgi:hypothetical protein
MLPTAPPSWCAPVSRANIAQSLTPVLQTIQTLADLQLVVGQLLQQAEAAATAARACTMDCQ